MEEKLTFVERLKKFLGNLGDLKTTITAGVIGIIAILVGLGKLDGTVGETLRENFSILYENLEVFIGSIVAIILAFSKDTMLFKKAKQEELNTPE